MSARAALRVRSAIALVVLSLASLTLIAAASRDGKRPVSVARPQIVSVIAQVAP